MEKYLHKVAGIYTSQATAERTRNHLVGNGFALDQIDILLPMESSSDNKIEPEGDEVLKEVVKDGLIGTVVGGGVGALGVAAMVAANVTLFLASPLLGPLTIIGWGASAGAIAGASIGAGMKEGRFADIVRDAGNSGHTVLIAHTLTDEQTRIAQDMITASVAEPSDIQAV